MRKRVRTHGTRPAICQCWANAELAVFEKRLGKQLANRQLPCCVVVDVLRMLSMSRLFLA